MISLKQTAWSVMGVAALTLMSDLPVNAVSLTPLEASTITQGTFTDVDFGLLVGFTEFQPGQTLDYDSTTTDSGWSSTFSGTYLGIPFEVTYLGDSSTFETTDTITWTSNGFFGGDVWDSVGSALFSDTPTGFQIDFDNSVTLGSNTGMINTIIQASEDKTFLSTSGTGMINGMPLSELSHGYRQETLMNSHLIFLNYFIYLPPIGPIPPIPIPIFTSGKRIILAEAVEISSTASTTTVPEPGTIFGLLTIGTLGLFLKNKKQSH